jgi:hypothetical protein
MAPDPNELLKAISQIDAQLSTILPHRDSLTKALDRLDAITTDDVLVEEASEQIRLWQDSGLFYAHTGRLIEAIQLFSVLHEKLCSLRLKNKEWLPCGMPLVWVSDYYRSVGCPHLAFKYLILSGISDAIRDQGVVNPDAGFYWRARWLEGISDQQIKQLYSDAFAEYEKGSKYRFFPEFLLARIGANLIAPYPSRVELDRYALNHSYAQTILENITSAERGKGPIDGKDLEALAEYLLGCIPGFEIVMNITTGDSQVDALVRNRGPRYDFREDLGAYMVVECKDWSKPVSSKEVGWFVNKLLTQECKAGILFSSEGITGDSTKCGGEVRYAALTLLKAYQRAGTIVMVLNKTDFQKAASEGANLIRLLQSVYEQVRFDMRA